MACFLRASTTASTIIIILLVSLVLNHTLSFAENKRLEYVGTKACKGCHSNEYNNFMKYAKKAKSFESIERLKRGLTDEELKKCYSCHTTGYGRAGGFESPEKTPHLKNAGCEVCHGPGNIHVQTKNSRDIKRKFTMADCTVCHTEERIRAFKYRPLKHGGAH
ncbi:MAG: cytochrome c family protein [Nitrospira sp.]|nr:cytochrome c family protein [Nitrospira sp.]